MTKCLDWWLIFLPTFLFRFFTCRPVYLTDFFNRVITLWVNACAKIQFLYLSFWNEINRQKGTKFPKRIFLVGNMWLHTMWLRFCRRLFIPTFLYTDVSLGEAAVETIRHDIAKMAILTNNTLYTDVSLYRRIFIPTYLYTDVSLYRRFFIPTFFIPTFLYLYIIERFQKNN